MTGIVAAIRLLIITGSASVSMGDLQDVAGRPGHASDAAFQAVPRCQNMTR